MVVGNVKAPTPHELFDADIAGVITSWIDGVVAALDAQLLLSSNRPVGHNNELTLLKHGDDVVVVSWDNGGRPDALMGRTVKIHRGRATWIIPGITPIRSYAPADILIPAIGMRIEKERGRQRPAVPPAILRMMRMALSLVIIMLGLV